MKKTLLLLFVGIFVCGVLLVSNNNIASAEKDHVDLWVKLDPALEQMEVMSLKVVTTGRTARKTFDLDDPFNTVFYKDYNLVNFVYFDRMLITAMFYNDDNPQYYRSLTLVIDEDQLKEKMRDNKLYLYITPSSITIK